MITIFADASFDPNTGRAGWGAWMAADKQFIEAGGPINPGGATDASHAELLAIVFAVNHAKSVDVLQSVVMLQSDSTVALGVVRQKLGAFDSPAKDGLPVYSRRKPLRVEWEPAATTLSTLLDGRKVFVRHVRGHRPGPGRSWVNNRCDHIARRYMRNGIA